MPDPVYTRISGYHPTGSEINLGDRIFNGPQQINALGHTALGSLPYAGGIYTAGRGINALLHYLGTLFNNPQSGTSAPTSVNYGGSVPQGPGTFTNDPTDPNNPGAYSLGSAPASTGAVPPVSSNLGPGGIPLSVWQQVYNTGRFTNAPAFSPSLQQAQFPGSRIGPGGTSVANPYNPNATHGTPNPVFTQLSGPAVDARNEILRRNII